MSNYLEFFYVFLDYSCHLVQCSGGARDSGCNSDTDQFQVDKDVQVNRDYPSFSQIKRVINENSKCIFHFDISHIAH